MTITTFNTRTFARDAAAIKRATEHGPVIITDRGKPSLAVLRIEDYYRMSGQPDAPSLLEAMQAIAGAGGIELGLPSRRDAGMAHRVPSFDEDAV